MIESAIANPFLFLQPYDLKGKYVLKGRTNETEALLALLHWKEIIVVYGKSGVGKTSFINFTLSDKINRVSWLPVRITRLRDINKSFRDRLSQAMKAESIDEIHDNVLPELNTELKLEMKDSGEKKEAIAEQTVDQVRELCHYWNRPVYLIIDQLEELFLIGDKPEQEIFLETLRQLVKAKNIKKKIILVLREEHLAYVQEIERILGGVFQDSLAIHEIKASESEEILTSLLSPGDESTETIPEDLSEFAHKVDPFKAKLIASCVSNDKLSVQQLQVLLFILWEILMLTEKEADPEKIADIVNDVTDSPDPLRDYVNETVNKALGQDARLLKARYWFILTHSISAANTKKPVSLSEYFDDLVEDLKKNEDKYPIYTISRSGRRGQKAKRKATRQLDFEVNKDAMRQWCEELTEKRLLEQLPGEEPDGECFFQLTHDTLAPAIQQSNTNAIITRQQEAGLQLRFPRKFRITSIDENPYQGLQQYEFAANEGVTNSYDRFGREKKNKLYGRAAIIEDYTNVLLQEGKTCLVIVGDSGTGKSSLVNGGILPALEAAGYITEIRQPGPDLINFRREIEALVDTSSNPTFISKKCLYIDQFEECYTYRKFTKEESESFIEFLDFLSKAIKKCGPNFKLIVTIRHDYAHEFDRKLNDWRGFKKLLRYPNADEIFDIIVGPAYDKGLHFHPANLPEIIAADAANTSYFLPLLSYTMKTLYQKDIVDNYEAIEDGALPCLTLKSYEEIGGVVNCLQQQFTERFNTTENSHLFLQLLPRMIVIKDMIAKSRLLPEKDIDFIDPEKREQCIDVLNAFAPDFIRKRDVVINGNTEECFEPLHDSLLTFCDEIRQLINPGPEGDYQTRLQLDMQPKLDLAVQEWLKAKDEQRLAVVKKHFWSIEPLIELVDKDRSKFLLFKQEHKFIDHCLENAKAIRNAERQAELLQIRELDNKREQERLRSEKLQAELDFVTAETQRKHQELESKRLAAELQAEKARGKYKLLYQSLSILLFLLTIALAAVVVLGVNNKKAKTRMQIETLQK